MWRRMPRCCAQDAFVLSTNETAVRLWRRHGFEVVGTLPEVFLHPERGYVDAFVMYKRLKD